MEILGTICEPRSSRLSETEQRNFYESQAISQLGWMTSICIPHAFQNDLLARNRESFASAKAPLPADRSHSKTRA